ncbi:zinc finger protein RFP-like [Lacerta agilis]|uniref:zinc finger protein RFP-like n=1 Tax=Lacerta agilis TaxID=80427 RepID=UPI00141A3E58|nr:zinc finger protein RFP-like [Lacerta agilis]
MAAAAGGHIQRLRDEATCSICLDYFKDPVTIPECGHNFCRSCLIQCWGESEAEASCPQCRERVQRRSLIPNRQLANVVEIAQNLSLQEVKKEGGEGGVCEDHQEPLKLFCKIDEAPICVVCDRSKEHKHHEVIPLKEAFEEYKGEICNHLEILRKEREEILAYQADLDKESKDLLDVRSTLQRYEKREHPEKPLAFPPELRNRILESCDLNHLVEDAMKQWKDALLFRKPIQKDVQSFRNLQRANVTLDPDTAHPNLILSEDRKSVRYGDKKQDLPDNPERFNDWPCVLGLEGFTAGRHFWEVNVGSGEWWVVGVARKSVRRKGSFSLKPEGGIWVVEKSAGKYWAWTSPDPFPLSLSWEPRRIRVTLDYEGRRVSFSDADSGAELYTFSGASFSGETLLPFFYLWGDKTHLAEASCPQCRERVQRRSLIPNRQLANVVELIEKLSVQGGKEEERNGGVCEDHQEPLKLFCKIDEAPICVVCDRSKEHKHHEVIPLKEAFEEYKGEICNHLEILRKEREEILAYQADLDKESKDLFKLTETERLKTVEKFKELRQFLEEQEKHLLTHVEEVEKEIAGRRDEQLARLSRKLSSLEKIIQEMEEKGQQPASELLQDVRSTLQRYEKRESPEKPLAFLPELRDRILDSCDLNHLVEDTMKQWKDAVLYRKPIQKDVQSFRNLQRANVTLDPDTAHPQLILSKDGKSVRRGDKEQDLPDNPERFNCQPCVLGREGFTAGRHFWEVNVGSGKWWAVGVARKSVRRKGFFYLSPEEGVWAVGKFGGKYSACTSPHSSPLSLREKPRRIRVTLDYEGGRVSFSDADSGAALYTFSGASFSGETLLPFFGLCRNKTHLSIS